MSIMTYIFMQRGKRSKVPPNVENIELVSCPWRPATANGVDLIMPKCMPKIRSMGPTASAGMSVTYGRKARKYIRRTKIQLTVLTRFPT